MMDPNAGKKFPEDYLRNDENERTGVLPKNGPRDEYEPDDEPGRNDPCSCGSGRKYKRCCLRDKKEARGKIEGAPAVHTGE